jgi:hypothetical protein
LTSFDPLWIMLLGASALKALGRTELPKALQCSSLHSGSFLWLGLCLLSPRSRTQGQPHCFLF